MLLLRVQPDIDVMLGFNIFIRPTKVGDSTTCNGSMLWTNKSTICLSTIDWLTSVPAVLEEVSPKLGCRALFAHGCDDWLLALLLTDNLCFPREEPALISSSNWVACAGCFRLICDFKLYRLFACPLMVIFLGWHRTHWKWRVFSLDLSLASKKK